MFSQSNVATFRVDEISFYCRFCVVRRGKVLLVHFPDEFYQKLYIIFNSYRHANETFDRNRKHFTAVYFFVCLLCVLKRLNQSSSFHLKRFSIVIEILIALFKGGDGYCGLMDFPPLHLYVLPRYSNFVCWQLPLAKHTDTLKLYAVDHSQHTRRSLFWTYHDFDAQRNHFKWHVSVNDIHNNKVVCKMPIPSYIV